MLKLSIFLTFLLVSVQSIKCHGDGDVLGEFLHDILRDEHSPAVISARVCWSTEEKVAFIKHLPWMIQFIRTADDVKSISDDYINKIFLFVDMNCADSRSFLVSVETKYFGHPYRWIILNENVDYLSSLSFLPDSNVIVANDMGNHSIELKQVYKIEANHERMIEEPYGHWNYGNGFRDLRKSKVLAVRRRNLQAKRFKTSIVILNNDTVNHLDDYRDTHVDGISKATYIITKRLMESVNASFEYVITNTWGYKDPKTGIYSGMTGHLQRKEVDIGGTILYMVPDRVPLLEYLSMILPTKAFFVFRAPPLSYTSNIFALPFTGVVWACSTSLVLLASFVLYLSYRYGYDRMMAGGGHPISDLMLGAVGVVCQMGSQLSPRVVSGRISLFFFCLAMLFIYTSYTANIVALLQSTTKSINTIEDLMRSSLDIGVQDTPYARYYLPNAVEPTRKAFYKAKMEGKPSLFVNLSYGIENMRKGLYAMHMELGIGYKQVKDTFHEHEKCGLVQIQFIEQIDPWFGIQKHSPYKEILKTNVIRIRELGIQKRENAKLYTDKPTCNSKGQNFGSVRLIDCYAVWLVLGYGCALSCIILLFEFIAKGKMQCTSIRSEKWKQRCIVCVSQVDDPEESLESIS